MFFTCVTDGCDEHCQQVSLLRPAKMSLEWRDKDCHCDVQEVEFGEGAASAAEGVLTHPLDIGSPAAELAMLEASQEPLLDAAPALEAPGEPVQGALIGSPEMAAQAGVLGSPEPDVAAESLHAQATEAAPGQAEASEEEDDEDRCDFR